MPPAEPVVVARVRGTSLPAVVAAVVVGFALEGVAPLVEPVALFFWNRLGISLPFLPTQA